jgi:hypothetical protein
MKLVVGEDANHPDKSGLPTAGTKKGGFIFKEH